ncbi:MAG: aminopeptidase P family protein [Anaerolineae bacterium]|nr:aminopeptidase P family protein [Anaerolineae bacterium]
MLNNRQTQLICQQHTAGVDCVALVPGPNLNYVSGLALHASERPIVAFFPVQGQPVVVLPVLERGRAEKMVQGNAQLIGYTDEDGPTTAFAQASRELGLSGKRIAVEHLHMRVLELHYIEQAATGAEFVSLEAALPGLRAIKDVGEIATMRRAVAITEQALHKLIARPLIGLTEKEIAVRLEQLMRQAGADGVAFIIVVAGPNSADPHAGPSDRPVQSGDLVVIDCGATYGGYPADLTRTFSAGTVSDELKRIYEVVRQANAAGKAVVRAGVPAQEVDRAARRVIDAAGYGPHFFHRTGHGLGLEVHEPPYIVEGNGEPLSSGMVFTVEPGIYLPGVGGVRIEDNVVVTVQGVDCLTTFERELQVLG